MQINHPLKLQRGINSLILNSPFYASVLLNQKIICDNSKPTFSVNGKTLKYNEKFLDSLTHDEIVGVLAHEVEHLARHHHLREKGRNHKEWNEACDYAINPLLVQAGFKLPKEALIDPSFPIGECAENIYRSIQQKKQEEQSKKEQEKKDKEEKDNAEKQNDPNGNPEPDDNGEPQEDSQSGKSEKNDKKDDKDENDNDESDNSDDSDNESDDSDSGDNEGNGNGNSDDESENGNGSGESEENDDNAGGFGEVEQNDNKNLGEEEEKIEVIVQQAIQAAKTRGKLPAHLERLNNEVPPSVDWKEELAKFLNERASNDYSMAKPNKRFMNTGFIMPSLYSKVFGEVVMIRDTSGSIGQNEADKFMAETKSLLEVYEQNGQAPKLTIIDCDSEIHQIREYEGEDSIPLMGGGGTDFNKPFIHVNQSDINPICAIYLTDGWGPVSIENMPNCPVIWCLICHNPSFVESVPFGECIYIDDITLNN